MAEKLSLKSEFAMTKWKLDPFLGDEWMKGTNAVSWIQACTQLFYGWSYLYLILSEWDFMR